MTIRPASMAAALFGLLVLGGCAGTPAESASGSAPSTPAATSSAAPSSAEPSPAEPSSSSGQRIEVSVASGQVSGDTGRVPVAVGTPVTLVITSDVADQVHVHGYDIEQELAPGTPATLQFDATLPGVFEVELHEAHTVLLRLQVS